MPASRSGSGSQLLSARRTLGLLCHVAQMTDQLGGSLVGAFADGFEDARLGDTVEVVAEGVAPAGFDDVETVARVSRSALQALRRVLRHAARAVRVRYSGVPAL